MPISRRLACFLGLLLAVVIPPASAADTIPVTITVDASHTLGPLREIWRFFGADEPNYAYAPNGAKLLGELGELRPGRVYFRAHNLLTSGDGSWGLKWGSTNVYTEDEEGRPVYDWTIVDRIFDTYLARGVRPYVEVGFMPEALSAHPTPYRHNWKQGDPYERIFTGWAYPPKDYEKWGELVEQWVRHCVERYGADEVSQWYWETWNEANAGYWQGSDGDYLKLHDYTVAAIRRALSTARIGGADTAGHGGEFTRRFLEHSLRGVNFAKPDTRGTPIDFISFHAKGEPEFVEGHVRMNMARQLRTIDWGFAMIGEYEHLRDLPIVIGESDPEGCAACRGERQGYRNGTMYSSYTAACFARTQDLADRHGVNLEGALTWAFEFEDQPIFAGFRALATHGIDKPVLNVFRMFSKMSGERIEAESDHARSLNDMLEHSVRDDPDIAAFASRDGDRVSVMVWHYHDDDLPGPDAEIEIRLKGLRETLSPLTVRQYRIDRTHSNAYTAWLDMGSPPEPTPAQQELLEAAGQLAELSEPDAIIIRGVVGLRFNLPRQGVSLFVFEPARAQP
ncbi:MAG: beta-xylosidase [Phycisphaeraceae bacterium]|nr:MAG: beta-xylosidase [Phycisphaeraceae bacterium]